MKKVNVLIITAPTKSGKTTFLTKWIANRNDVTGILTPVKNGKRYFHNISDNSFFEMESADKNENVLTIGNYLFSVAAFKKASAILTEPIANNISFLIIDEIGPLEMLEHKGFYNALKKILDYTYKKLQIIIVVRESLINKVTTLCNEYNKTVSVMNFSPIINGNEDFLL